MCYNVELSVKINYRAKATLEKSAEKLNKHLNTFDDDVDLKSLPTSEYLMHDKFTIKDKFFFTFKDHMDGKQIRLLCHVNSNAVKIIDFHFKKKNNFKYYDYFREKARNYVLSQAA